MLCGRSGYVTYSRGAAKGEHVARKIPSMYECTCERPCHSNERSEPSDCMALREEVDWPMHASLNDLLFVACTVKVIALRCLVMVCTDVGFGRRYGSHGHRKARHSTRTEEANSSRERNPETMRPTRRQGRDGTFYRVAVSRYRDRSVVCLDRTTFSSIRPTVSSSQTRDWVVWTRT